MTEQTIRWRLAALAATPGMKASAQAASTFVREARAVTSGDA